MRSFKWIEAPADRKITPFSRGNEVFNQTSHRKWIKGWGAHAARRFFRGRPLGEAPNGTRESRVLPKAEIHKFILPAQIGFHFENDTKNPLFPNYGMAVKYLAGGEIRSWNGSAAVQKPAGVYSALFSFW